MKEYLLGVVCAIFIIGGLHRIDPNSVNTIHREAMAKCEKSLPRDQKCVIIAVPEMKETK